MCSLIFAIKKFNTSKSFLKKKIDLISDAETWLIASTYTSGGEVREATSEGEQRNVVWEVEVKYGGNEFEIIVDAGSGKVLGAFHETESLFESWFDE